MTTPDNTRRTATPGAEVNNQGTGADSHVVDPTTQRFQASISNYFDLLHGTDTGSATGQPAPPVTPADYRPGAYSVPITTTEYRPGAYTVPVETADHRPGPFDSVIAAQRPRDGGDNGDRRTTTAPLEATIDPSKQYRDVAMQAQQQLETVLAKYRKPDGTPTGVPVTDADKRQIADYQRTMTENFERALVLTGGKTAEEAIARQQQIAARIDAFTSVSNGMSKEQLRQSLCQQYGLDANTVSVPEIQQRLQGATTREDRDALTRLTSLETEREQLIVAQMAPALVRAQMSRAYLAGDMNTDVEGAVKHHVPFEQVNMGAKLAGDANQVDASGIVRASNEFQALLRLANQEVSQGMRLTQTTAGGGGQGDAAAGTVARTTDATRPGPAQAAGGDTRVQQMLDEMNKAAQYEKEGKADLAMKAHEDANKLAEALSKTLIPQYMQDLKNQTDPTVQQQMLATIMLVERQRMDEASYLQRRSQHQPDDYSRSLSLLNDARGEWATLERLNPSHYGANAGNDAWPSLSADPTFNQLLNKALTGGKTLDGDLTQINTRIQQALDGKHYEALYQAVGDGQRIAGNWPTAEMQANVAQMKQHQTELQAQLTQAQADTTLSPEAKAARIATIQGQLASSGEMMAFDQSKLNQKDNLVYLEGYAQYLRGSEHFGEANQKLHEFMQTDLYRNATPEQRKAWGLEDGVGPDGKEQHGLLYATDPANQPNWFQRNIGWIAPVAGIAVGAACFWMGPGSFAAGAGTAAFLTACGTAVVATAAGAGAYTLARGAAGEHVDGSTFVDGLKWGALGVSLVAAPQVATRFGLSFSAPATGLGRFAVPAVNRMIVGGMTATPFASIQAGQDLANGKPVGETALDFTKTVGLNAAFAGIPLGNASSTGRLWSPLSRSAAFISPGQQIILPQVVRAGMQQYVDAREYLHGPNDPTNPDDQVRMSQLEAQHPLNTYVPDTTRRNDNPNQ